MKMLKGKESSRTSQLKIWLQLVWHFISAAVWVGEICLRCDGLAGWWVLELHGVSAWDLFKYALRPFSFKDIP